MVGRPRPDLIERCRLEEKLDKFFTLKDCELGSKIREKVVRQGFQSFYSAHSSGFYLFILVSFTGMSFLSFYLADKMCH